MEDRGLVGLEARAADGTEIGRISGVITDEESGEETHVLVEQEDDGELEVIEIPISRLSLDPEVDFVIFHTDPSDDEPGDHLGDEVEPEGYAPAESDAPDDYEHENQFVTTPTDPADAKPPEDIVKESGEAGDWQDEGFLPDSGYPRNDVYVDPDSGQERERYPAEGEDLRGDVEQFLDGTELAIREVREGVIVLEGSVAGQGDLDEILADIRGIEGVLDVDTTDVDVG